MLLDPFQFLAESVQFCLQALNCGRLTHEALVRRYRLFECRGCLLGPLQGRQDTSLLGVRRAQPRELIDPLWASANDVFEYSNGLVEDGQGFAIASLPALDLADVGERIGQLAQQAQGWRALAGEP